MSAAAIDARAVTFAPGALVASALAASLLASAATPTHAYAAENARSFTFTQELTVPRAATVWVPLPSDDAWQTVTELSLTGAPWERVYDSRWGNAMARVHATSATKLTLHARTTRRERSDDPARTAAITAPAPDGYTAWLQPDARVPPDARVRHIAADVMRGKATPLAQARAAYDYVLSTMRYDKPAGPEQHWGNGDLEWACDKHYGNCTDFHALFIGLLRSAGIPARFSIGYAIPRGTDGGPVAGYHCWAEFYLAGAGWIAVDASEGWKQPARRDYYFGHHDPDRVQLSTGRDVPLPGMRGTALNYFVFPYAEASDGSAVEISHRNGWTP